MALAWLYHAEAVSLWRVIESKGMRRRRRRPRPSPRMAAALRSGRGIAVAVAGRLRTARRASYS